MSRQTDLLRAAADAIYNQQSPLEWSFTTEHDVTLDEHYNLAALLAAGAQVMAWAMDNPARAAVAFRAAKLDELITLMESAGGGSR